MKSLIKEIEDKFDELEEANVTANLDGGEGPPKTPHAFSKSEDEDDLERFVPPFTPPPLALPAAADVLNSEVAGGAENRQLTV